MTEASSAHSHAGSCNHHHGHDHAHAVDTSTVDGRRRVAIAGCLTFAFMFAEIIGGLVSGSLALLADAAHMMTDAASLGLAWLGYQLSMRPAGGQQTFGFGRYRVLAAFVNGVLLIVLAGWIIFEAVNRLVDPHPVMGGLLLGVAILGLAVNLVSFYVLHQGDHDDLNLRGALWHVAGDLLGSIAAIVAALVIIQTGWMPIDPLLSMLVAGIVVFAGVRILKASGRILVQAAPEEINVDQVRTSLEQKLGDAASVEALHIWNLTESETHVSAVISMKGGSDRSALLADIHAVLSAITDESRLIIDIRS